MTEVVYSGPFESVETGEGLVFPKGVAVSVDAATAESLLIRSDFTSAPAAAPAKDGK